MSPQRAPPEGGDPFDRDSAETGRAAAAGAHSGAAVHNVVSSPDERLILVDESDRPVGQASKRDCHAGSGLLHRAFSLLIFNSQGNLLLQRRAEDKPLWPGFWSNSCCSHPRVDEDVAAAARRRAREELGLKVDPRFLYKFQYRARYLEQGSENELCSVFLGRTDGDVRANPNEVADWRYVAPETMDAALSSDQHRFTPWFRMEWDRVRSHLADMIT